MQRQGFSTKNIEYFERDFLDQTGVIQTSSLRINNLGNLDLYHLKGISKFWENEAPHLLNQVIENMVSGFYEGDLPIIFSAFGGKTGLEIYFGTSNTENSRLADKSEILKSSLTSSLYGLELFEVDESNLHAKISEQKYFGLLTGTPSEQSIEGKMPDLDILMRGISDKNCGISVIAAPMKNSEINNLFSMVLNEVRIILESERHSGQENPTVRQYKILLEKYLEKIQISKSQGLWSTSIFLHADSQGTLNQLKAIAKSAFSGRDSIPDRIRTHQLSKNTSLGLIVNPPPPSPGQFKWPYYFSTILNSGDLARHVKLPGIELPGYKIKPFVRFNVSPDERDGIEIGEIIDQGNKIGHSYKVPLKSLKKHGLIVGGTGSGKTNTLFFILRDLLEQDIPFLVLEPAKTEYRKLLFDDAFKERLQVFTLGDNNVSPFRLNPFYIQKGVSVQTHLDLLKSVFNASFYMWGPLPHVLEQCLYEVYIDKGWNLTTNLNSRGISKNSYPTITDLYNKVDDVVDKLGYSPETNMELKSSLKTRLNSLRIGGKGLMLDTKSSIDFGQLLAKPTVLELESLGDDEEKSFLMGLVLTMLYEYYVSQGIQENTDLSHVTIIEEAHRLLGSTGKDTAFSGDMKGKAVETFTNILSEIRAYGEGFLIAEQIPTKLSSDVIKNTNLKVMHRIVSEDDRRIMAASMTIKETDAPIVSTLRVGEAVVFSEGDDGAYNIKVPYAKLGEIDGTDEDRVIKQAMKKYLDDPEFQSPYKSCSRYCKHICEFKDQGNIVSNIERFSSTYPKLVLSLLENSDYTENLEQMFETGNDVARISGDILGTKLCAAIQGTEKYFEELGRSYHWCYEDQEQLLSQFLDIYIESLQSYLENGTVVLYEKALNDFKDNYTRLVTGIQPTSYCAKICKDNTCQYRYLILEKLEDEDHQNSFIEIINSGGSEMWRQLNIHCQTVAIQLNPSLSKETLQKVSTCYALQKTYQFDEFSQRHIAQVMNNLVEFNNIDIGDET
jgi:hypothetical protein